jgi:DNA repair exonuclease SbcCD ATPase subunit
VTGRLLSLELESFRGFARREKLDLDADAVVLSGANGVGKTSVFDGLTWALTGELPRFGGGRRERRTEDVIVNRYTGAKEAEVVVEMTTDGTDLLRVRRLGSSRSSAVTVEHGNEALSGETAELRLAEIAGFADPGQLTRALTDWGMLRQDAMRAVLDARPDSFQETLREMLGLQVLGAFERFVTASASEVSKELTAARQALNEAQLARDRIAERLQVVRALLADASGVSEAAGVLAATLASVAETVDADMPDPVTPETLRRWSVAVRQTRSELEEVFASRASLQRPHAEVAGPSLDLAVMDETVARAESAVEERHADASRLRLELDRLQTRAADRERLVEAALALLTDTCPVCGQSIVEQDVREHLETELASASDGASLATTRASLEDAETRFREAEQALSAARQATEAARIQAQARAALAEAGERLAHRVAELALPDRAIRVSIADLDAGLAGALVALDQLQSAASVLQSTLDATVQAAEESRLVGELRAAEDRLATTRDRLELVAGRELDAKNLSSAATAAAVDVTRDWLNRLTPYFSEVFRRIAPHPTFARLGLDHDVYYGKGRSMPRVYDDQREIDANPNSIFSEGQLSVVALSFFLAFALFARTRAFPFVALDDPMQFMDDRNVLGFSDLCRMLRSRRQLLVTSHDRRFSELLLRKLGPRTPENSTLHLRFDSWDREGPVIDTSRLETWEAPFVLLNAA